MKALLLLALIALSANAAPLASLKADVDGDSKADLVTLSGQAGSDFLRLEIRLAKGAKIESRQLVRKLRRAELSLTPFGILVGSIEDQSSAAKAYDYLIAVEKGQAELASFEFHYDYPATGSGHCYVTPASGVAIFNGNATEIAPRQELLPGVSGARYEDLCHELALKR